MVESSTFRLYSCKLTWLAGKWILNEDGTFPIEHGDIPASYISLPESSSNVIIQENALKSPEEYTFHVISERYIYIYTYNPKH